MVANVALRVRLVQGALARVRQAQRVLPAWAALMQRLRSLLAHALIRKKQWSKESTDPLEEAVAAHLCLLSALGLKAHAVHPSKPCRTTSALPNKAYAVASQARSALHTMEVLQVFQVKLLSNMDESGQHQNAFKELCTETDLTAMKATAQAINKTMASLVVFEHHLWLNLTEIRDAEKMAFLDSLVSLKGLFGPVVNGFAQCFSEAQKKLQVLRHFLPKCSGAVVSSRQKAQSTRPTKPAPPQPHKYETEQTPIQQRPRTEKWFPYPKRHGPRPQLVLDPES